MAGMAAEPEGCWFSECGTPCGAEAATTYTTACGNSADGVRSRCCPSASYPDVLLMVDRGQGQATPYLWQELPHADYSPLHSEWTGTKELLALPGALTHAAVSCCLFSC